MDREPAEDTSALKEALRIIAECAGPVPDVGVLQGAAYPLEGGTGHPGVEGGGGDVLVSQEQLYVPQGDAVFQQMRGKGMTQIMGCRFLVYPRPMEGRLQNLLHRATGKMFALRGAGGRKDELPRPSAADAGAQVLHEGGGKDRQAVLAPLTPPDVYGQLREVDVPHAQRRKLREPQARGIEEADHHPVFDVPDAFQYPGYLLPGEDGGDVPVVFQTVQKGQVQGDVQDVSVIVGQGKAVLPNQGRRDDELLQKHEKEGPGVFGGNFIHRNPPGRHEPVVGPPESPRIGFDGAPGKPLERKALLEGGVPPGERRLDVPRVFRCIPGCRKALFEKGKHPAGKFKLV